MLEKKKDDLYLRAFKSIIDASKEFLVYVDRDYIFRAVNKAYLNAYNKKEEEVIGHEISEITGKQVFNSLIIKRFKKCLSGRVVRKKNWFTYPAIGTRYMEVTYYPFNDETGDIEGVIVNIRDITEQIEVKNKLDFERKQLLLILENLNCPVYVADTDTYEILYVNSRLKEDFKTNPVGCLCYKFFQGLDSPCDFCTNDIIREQKGKPYLWEYHNLFLDTDNIVTDRIIEWPDGRDVRLEIVTDITELKKKETALRKAKETTELARISAETANKAKSDFLANISHEFRTPLNGIIGITNLLKESGLNSYQMNLLSMLELSSDNLFNILSDLLDFSQINKGKLRIKPVYFNFRDLIKMTIDGLEYLTRNKDIEIEYTLCRGCDKYFGDRIRINQILLNLLTNAIKYTEKGEIKVTVTKNSMFEISVSDTGIGIPEEKLNTIFDSFKQIENPYTKVHQGVGLGLSIVKQIVNLMKGEITVKSEIDKGSTFTVKLPITDLSENDKHEENTDYKKHMKKAVVTDNVSQLRILVAEDEAINRMYITTLLKKKGWVVDEAGNGIKVLDMLNKKKYDIIIMDISMPEMDGITAALEIRKLKDKDKRSTPIIALTAHAYPEDLKRCLKAGMNDYISKPIDEKMLFRKIGKTLNL